MIVLIRYKIYRQLSCSKLGRSRTVCKNIQVKFFFENVERGSWKRLNSPASRVDTNGWGAFHSYWVECLIFMLNALQCIGPQGKYTGCEVTFCAWGKKRRHFEVAVIWNVFDVLCPVLLDNTRVTKICIFIIFFLHFQGVRGPPGPPGRPGAQGAVVSS